jgi:4-diphosphocytidyl-2-C-methyl-D-erythritol kinase
MTYRSYGKINIFLDVLNKRRDGYHNIETIFQTVSLYDELTFNDDPNHISITCTSPDLDTGEGNLVYKAADLLRKHSNCRLGAQIHLAKQIPIAAGMAGGSGNAAAALIALNKLWDLRWSDERLRALALEIGSDVPYCTMGGTAAATRRGEELEPLPPPPRTWIVLVHPPVAVSAARTYNHEKLRFNTQAPFAGRTASFRRAIRLMHQGDWAGAVFNRMEDPVFHDMPQLAEVKKQLVGMGCLAAAMSGSGPTLFGICKDQAQARAIGEKLTDYRTSVVQTMPLGVERVR